jgi:lactate permease
VAALPIAVLLLMLGVLRKPAWIAAVTGLAATAVVALAAYGMPLGLVVSSALFGAAFGLFPIGWILFAAILLYRVTVETGKFDIIKDSLGHLTHDPRLQGLLIAFAFGAFIEGASGFGSPVAIAAAMLAGLGFSPFYAACICLLANTAPVAFGSIGIPVVTLAAVTGLPKLELSAAVGRICAPVSLIIPAYLVVVMAGWKGLRGVLPAALLCGAAFAGVQFLVSNFVGPELTDILGSLAAIGALILLFLWWKPRDQPERRQAAGLRHSAGELLLAWAPYGLLVVFVLLWGYEPVRNMLNRVTIPIAWPGLHNVVERVPPVVPASAPYAASTRSAGFQRPGRRRSSLRLRRRSCSG